MVSNPQSDNSEHLVPLAKTAQNTSSDVGEMLSELKKWLDSGLVKIDSEADKYYSILGVFPIGVNRIDWRGVRDYKVFDVLHVSSDTTTAEVHAIKLIDCRKLLLDWFDHDSIDMQTAIVWIGDNTSIAMHMSVSVFIDIYTILFSWPQHHYVIPLTGEWCLNYTIEGQLFFGRAENAIAGGYIDMDSQG